MEGRKRMMGAEGGGLDRKRDDREKRNKIFVRAALILC